ncbi:MAG: YbaB/EbfC family nucleoid-associated protein [Bacillota bacterium]
MEGMGKLLGELGRVKEGLKKLRIDVSEGPVSLSLNGLQEVVRVKVDAQGAANVARLEAWLGTCFNKAIIASRQAAKEEIERLTGWSIPTIPGLI